MKQRVTVGAKEQRRDQRRPVSIAAAVGGIPVDLVDLSLTGVGGGTIALGEAAGLDIREGQDHTLDFTGPDGQPVSLRVKIQRIDHAAGEFAAAFAELSDTDFDAIEKLMFPRRGAAKTKA
jgi:hypothetical protein